jgi:hypothetical protein
VGLPDLPQRPTEPTFRFRRSVGLHCHVLSHAEAKTGMFGMVTALIVS